MEKDNWTLLLEEYRSEMGSFYKDHKDEVYCFVGLLDAPDDYYYAMRSVTTGQWILCSCVGSLCEGHLFTKVASFKLSVDPLDIFKP